MSEDKNRSVAVLQAFIEAHPTLVGEDGTETGVTMNPGASESAIAEFESTHGIHLPEPMKNLLRFSDGIDLYNFELQSLASSLVLADYNMMSIHDWGNGDCDCIMVADHGENKTGNIVFVNHRPSVVTLVAHSVYQWLSDVLVELGMRGTVMHPGDYREKAKIRGVYANVLTQLRGVDCELNQ